MIKRFDVYLVAFDPTIGHEIQKTRPCLVVFPDEINRLIGTVIVAPMTKGQQSYPTRVQVKFKGQVGRVALDQIRAVDKSQLIHKAGHQGTHAEQGDGGIAICAMKLFGLGRIVQRPVDMVIHAYPVKTVEEA